MISSKGWGVIVAWLVCAAAVPAAAQVQIHAEVDQNVISRDGQAVLTVTLSGNRAGLPDPELPSIPNMELYNLGRNEEMSIINRQVTSTIVYQFQLKPRFVGNTVIGPIGVTVDGVRYETKPIQIQVTRPNEPAPQGQAPQQARPQPGRPAPGGPDVFVTASVDKQKAYVNEQVTLTIRFHTGVTLLGNPQYTPPGLNGFISEDLPPERHGTTRVQGRQYHYSEIRTALFPAQSGRLTVGPAAIQAQVQAGVAVDPFAPDFFQKFFSQGLLAAQTRELRTDAIVVTAEPLPEAGKPASFSGAVGQYRVSGAVDKRNLKVGDALTLTVTVEGTGNLKALGTIKIPDTPSFRAFETVSSMNLSRSEDHIKGSKTFKTVLVPRVSGTLAIPSIPFSFFDPQKRAYVNAGTAPIDVEVSPAAGASPAPSYVTPQAGGGEVTAVLEDIRYVKESAVAGALSRFLSALAAQRAAHLTPLAIFLLALALGGYRERLLLDPQGARFRRAAGRAQSLLDEAEGIAETDASLAAAKVAEALTGFIADKLGRSASGLTLREAQESIRSRFPRIAPDRLERLKQLWQEMEELRFAQGAQGGGGHAVILASGVADLVKELDREMGSSPARKNGVKAALLLLALGAAAGGAQEPAPSALSRANQLYRDGQYAQAAEAYERLAAERNIAALEYNLANARFKENAPHALGRAIAGYLRAWELSPRDPDVRHNLEFALSRAGDTLVPPGTPKALFGLYHFLSRAELLGLQWVGYWACLLLAAAWLLAPALREKVATPALAALAFWAFFGGWWALRTLGSGGTQGVVLEPNAEARSGPGRNFPVSFNAPEGRRIVILSESGEWTEIGMMKEGLKGWVQAKSIEAVSKGD